VGPGSTIPAWPFEGSDGELESMAREVYALLVLMPLPPQPATAAAAGGGNGASAIEYINAAGGDDTLGISKTNGLDELRQARSIRQKQLRQLPEPIGIMQIGILQAGNPQWEVRACRL
jgi:hypothetical protein